MEYVFEPKRDSFGFMFGMAKCWLSWDTHVGKVDHHHWLWTDMRADSGGVTENNNNILYCQKLINL